MVPLANGVHIHYAEEGAQGSEVLLFIHGWPDSWFTFSRVLPLLPTGVRSIALDLPGFGDSDRPERYSRVEDLADSVIDFLDALSIGRATLVGHSLGSFIARCAAIRHPERVSGLALIGTGLSPVCPILVDAKEVVADLADPLPPEFVRDFQSGTAIVPLPDEFLERVISESLKAPARVWRDVLDGLLEYDDAKRLTQIATPVLIIWGERDALFEIKEDQERMAATLPNARLKVLPETGHCPNWERPEEVAAELTAFVAALSRT